MTCPCREKVGYMLITMQKEARARNGVLGQRVEAVQEAIRSGSMEIALRHLFRAGVYWASLDNNFARNPSYPKIIEALDSHVRKEWPSLNHLVPRVQDLTLTDGIIDEPKVMLRKSLRNFGPKTASTLPANAKNEVERCIAALAQAEHLRERLAVWREGIGLSLNPEVICIVDLHDDQR